MRSASGCFRSLLVLRMLTEGGVGGDVAQVGGGAHNDESSVALEHCVVGDVDGHLAHRRVVRQLLLCDPTASHRTQNIWVTYVFTPHWRCVLQ